MVAALQRAWQRRGPVAMLLWSLSFLYRWAVASRKLAYGVGLLRPQRLGVPVVVVGNVVAGGGGKTPLVMALVEHLLSQGRRPGVISRGYGRRTHGCLEVTAATDPLDGGDEAALVARRCQVPVFVAERRFDAGAALLARHPATDVIVCDDGLQHLQLARDIEICVFDAGDIGNGWLLPAGPLREPWPRAVDLVVRPEPGLRIQGFVARRVLAAYAVRSDGTRVALAALRNERCVALAGTAHPQAFFDMLQASGIRPERTVALPDHYHFDSNKPSLEALERPICTEKDAVKLWRHRPDALAVPLVVTPEPALFEAFDRLLSQAGASLSSKHGRPPA